MFLSEDLSKIILQNTLKYFTIKKLNSILSLFYSVFLNLKSSKLHFILSQIWLIIYFILLTLKIQLRRYSGCGRHIQWEIFDHFQGNCQERASPSNIRWDFLLTPFKSCIDAKGHKWGWLLFNFNYTSKIQIGEGLSHFIKKKNNFSYESFLCGRRH